MLNKIWSTLRKKNISCRHFQLKIIIILLIPMFLVLCRLALAGARGAQKEAVRSGADACAAEAEEYFAAGEILPTGQAEDGQIFPVSSPATFAVLRDGQILYTEGLDPLSQKLIESFCLFSSEADAPPETVHTFQIPHLPDCYLRYIPSQSGGPDYCYYEPVLSGWPLIRRIIFHPLGFLLCLLFAVILSALILLLISSGRPEENRVIEITVPYENNNTFGSFPCFSGIIIDYRNVAGGVVSPEILELFDQVVQENLSVNKILFQYSSKIHSDCLQYHINYSNYNLRVLCDSLKMNLYNAAPDYAVNIFYSEAAATCQEMEKELLYLHRHLRYSLLLGYGHRIPISTVRTLEASTEKLDDNVASTIQNHLRTRAYEDLYQYLNRHRDISHMRPRSQKYSFAEMYRFAEEAFSAVKLFFQENAFSHPMVHTSCSTVLRSAPGFDSLCDYLIAAIQSYQQENQHVLSTRNEQIMNSIYMYIEQDLAEANLNALARKLNMTDSHLSRVFKKNTGTNFSEYLSERKLEEAARLLVQDNKIKVADIADMLGYGNPTYFLSRFKAKYGVSPTAYRKTHLNTPIE